MKRTGAQVLWECLVKEGVETVFGYPGGAILPAYDAMLQFPIRHVLVRHEQGATHMADGYARASGKVGVAVATAVPAQRTWSRASPQPECDSSPIVCLTGQVAFPLLGTDAFQEIDITGVTLPITKHNYLVTRVEDLAPTLREAFYVARSGGPGRCSSTSPRTCSRRSSTTSPPRPRCASPAIAGSSAPARRS